LAALKHLSLKEYSKIVPLCDQELESPDSPYIFETCLLRGTFNHLWGKESLAEADFKRIVNSESVSSEVLRFDLFFEDLG